MSLLSVDGLLVYNNLYERGKLFKYNTSSPNLGEINLQVVSGIGSIGEVVSGKNNNFYGILDAFIFL